VAIRFPEVRMIRAHLSHPYEGECVATIRKHANVYADCAALHYQPFQLYHSLMQWSACSPGMRCECWGLSSGATQCEGTYRLTIGC
jgi:hypothetical protein